MIWLKTLVNNLLLWVVKEILLIVEKVFGQNSSFCCILRIEVALDSVFDDIVVCSRYFVLQTFTVKREALRLFPEIRVLYRA